MIARRRILVVVGAAPLAAALPVLSQQPRPRRIGYANAASLQTNPEWLAAFRAGMADLNWVDGRDYVIDARYGNSVQPYARLVAELIAGQSELLLVTSEEAARTTAQATRTLPIVFTLPADPVGSGLVTSLQRPGGNLTGLTTLSRDLGAKRLQLLKEAFPRIASVVVLFGNDAGALVQVKDIEAAAKVLGMRATAIELRQAADIEPAFQRAARLGAHAVMTIPGALLNIERRVIAERLLRAKVPGIFNNATWAEAGGLISYGTSSADNFRRAAAYVDKIFKGAKPGELPIQQPVKFELTVNLKSAKAMGFTLPQPILLRADRVIE